MMWLALASGSAVLSATAAILQKKVLMRTRALEFSFLVSAFIMVLSLLIPLWVDVLNVPGFTLMIILGKSVMGGAAFLLVMMSLEEDQISSVLPLLGLTPAVTAVASLLLTGESMQQWEWAGIGLMVAGTFLVQWRPGEEGKTTRSILRLSRSHGYIAAALVLFALSSIADKTLVSGLRTDPRIVLVYQHIVYCCMFAALLMLRKRPIRGLLSLARPQLPLLAAIALLTVAYRFTQLEATKDAPVALVLAVKRTSILYASFVGGRLFSDERLPAKLAGCALIVGAGFIILRNVV